jgi:hypothetical protein
MPCCPLGLIGGCARSCERRADVNDATGHRSGKAGARENPQARRPAGDSVALSMDGTFHRDGQPSGDAPNADLLGD